MGWFSIPFLLFLISSLTQLRLVAEGRAIPNPTDNSHSLEDNAIFRGQIGSRPPRCERMCSWCESCEAIQVPTNHQIKARTRSKTSSIAKIEYNWGEDGSNYKPMCWKCKCGNYIFNP